MGARDSNYVWEGPSSGQCTATLLPINGRWLLTAPLGALVTVNHGSRGNTYHRFDRFGENITVDLGPVDFGVGGNIPEIETCQSYPLRVSNEGFQTDGPTRP